VLDERRADRNVVAVACAVRHGNVTSDRYIDSATGGEQGTRAALDRARVDRAYARLWCTLFPSNVRARRHLRYLRMVQACTGDVAPSDACWTIPETTPTRRLSAREGGCELSLAYWLVAARTGGTR
jgi:hypothetical protein